MEANCWDQTHGSISREHRVKGEEKHSFWGENAHLSGSR